ncbi:tetratricopeptide repeat protein [Roseococcus sp. SDR]|uniref:tetratricopeptide repeat protein n=1 Tax=Roseococcus sp. SDR TaxID=2835532 RepID=UPI001BCF9306|nr:tetratricopeptide repeat protein [Roseococcus sp. SDR]MBS7790710.1 tetratricopeptide repeat protein [Roseococcus sp. SDR]MBV1846024.1 tetratricopeptide repeat protein [Roseococcus sp. SDR]
MAHDAQGNRATFASAEAAHAFDHMVEGFLKYRLDTPLRLKAVLQLDPEAPLPVMMKAGFAMLAYKAAHVPAAKSALDQARKLGGNAREQMHLAALDAWAEGGQDRAIAIWERIIAEHPRDILAFRFHHFAAFWMGKAPAMWNAVEGILPHWDGEVPGYGSVLACRAFANEEAGNLLIAEHAGREAIRRDPADLWAAHAVAHVLEMQGRRAEGIAWITGLRPHFEGGNNLMHHIDWHQAMFHLERGEHAEVLHLYDTGFRNLESPVTQMQPDLYIDCQNAASMLFRLERQGVDVGNRWEELAEKAEARIGDCLSAFTLPHWMMALCAAGRFEAADRMLAAMRDYAASNTGENPRVVREAALPCCEAVLLRARGMPAAAVAVMRPALGGMHELGGSHAQQDVLEQLFLDCAVAAGLQADAELLLERVTGRWPTPPDRRVGYRSAAVGWRG